ncbi:unnamed protein product [Linum trigynum]|uniref:Uncharacterized protein n=1 Tax=Linum trigynum TaxID=586398 RepID=A0AAV2FGE4_9ROSI
MGWQSVKLKRPNLTQSHLGSGMTSSRLSCAGSMSSTNPKIDSRLRRIDNRSRVVVVTLQRKKRSNMG